MQISFNLSGILHIPLLQMLKQGLIASQLNTPKLVIIPMFFEYVLDINLGLRITSQMLLQILRTIFADKRAQPNNNMCGLLLFAINTILVEWVFLSLR